MELACLKVDLEIVDAILLENSHEQHFIWKIRILVKVVLGIFFNFTKYLKYAVLSLTEMFLCIKKNSLL
jgi:hypothetical protein